MANSVLPGWLALGTMTADGRFSELVAPGYARQPIAFGALDPIRVASTCAGRFVSGGQPWPNALAAALCNAPQGGAVLAMWQIGRARGLTATTPWTFAPGDVVLLIPGLVGDGTAIFEAGAALGHSETGAVVTAGTRVVLSAGVLAAAPAAKPDDVRQRPPAGSDDAARGYQAGQLWLGPDGTLYQAAATTAGLPAIWAPQGGSSGASLAYPAAIAGSVPFIGLGARPLDAVPVGAGGFAYGTRLLASAYTGGAFDIQRMSDNAVKTIGFLSDGGLDTRTLDGFLAGTVGRITKWYDQSGNTNHATQTTAANAPTMVPFRQLGNARSVMFDARPEGTGSEPPCGPTRTVLNIPSTVALAGNALSVYAVGGFVSGGHNSALCALSDTNGHQMIIGANYQWSLATAAPGVVALGGGPAAFGPGLGAMDTPNVVSLISGPSAASLYHNDASASGHLAIGTINGGTLGAASFGSAMGFVDLAAVIAYPTAHTTPQQSGVLGGLYTLFGIAPQLRDVIVADGDSHTDSYGASFQQTWPRKMWRMLDQPTLGLTNTGVYGETAAARLANFSADVAPALARPARNKVATLFAGWNDIVTGVNPATVLGTYRQYASLVHQSGARFLVVASPLRAASPAQLQSMATLRALLAQNWSEFADGFVDLAAANPQFAMTSGWGSLNPNLFFADNIHFNDIGYSAIAAAMAGAVARLLV